MLRIGIECHNLEQSRAGVARSLSEMLQAFTEMPGIEKRAEFHLYFKKQIPQDAYLKSGLFDCKVLSSPIGRPSFTIFYNVLLPHGFARDKIDIAFFPSYMLPFGIRTPSVIEIHDVAYEAHPEWFHPFKRRYQYRILSRHGAKASKKIITISEFSKQEIVRFYGVDPEKVRVIYLGVSPVFCPEGDIKTEQLIKEKYGLGDNFILWVGQMLKRRHMQEALQGFLELAPRLPDLQFLVAGRNIIYPPADIDSLIGRINAKLGRKAVIRIPYLPDEELPHIYRASRLLVWLTSYEGMGLPIAESLACGTPVLTMRYGASKELFGDAAFFVRNPEDSRHVAQAMEKALTNERERARIRIKGLSLAKRFSWKKYGEGVLEVLEEVAKK